LSVRVRVLGTFEVINDGAPATFASRRAAQLVKILAVGGGSMPIDVIVEALWPEDRPGVGRTRLRNVLLRVRTVAPDLIVRSHDALALGPDVTVDVVELERAAHVALDGASSSAAAIAAAHRGIALFGGELLPGDPYAAWAQEARERVRWRVLDLFDLVIGDAVDGGDTDAAVRLLERSLELDPAAEDRRLLVVRLLLAEGRLSRAERHLRAARVVAEDLGITVATPLRRLEASLRGD
jgi:DNA-binding SARP family transcriptional activator